MQVHLTASKPSNKRADQIDRWIIEEAKDGRNKIEETVRVRIEKKNYYRLSGVCPRVLEMEDQWRGG